MVQFARTGTGRKRPAPRPCRRMRAPAEAAPTRIGARWLALLSLALALGLAAIGALQPAVAQSISATGDVNPAPSPNPATSWFPGNVTIGGSGQGTVTVEGPTPDTVNVVTEDMTVGGAGQGTLIIKNGATVETEGFAELGLDSGSQGTATVTGAESFWDVLGHFTVGDSGHATLTIEDGGGMQVGVAYIGYGSGSQGDVTVTGDNSGWGSSEEFYVGYSGTGTLTITDGGFVGANEAAILGANQGSAGTVTVTGRSSLTLDEDFTVGGSGTGTLIVTDGGSVTSRSTSHTSTVGNNGGSQGTVTITGSSSKWSTSVLHVGNSGTGTVTVEQGGTLDAGNTILGVNAGSSGIVTVTGEGSNWNGNSSGGDLYIGYSGAGTLTIEDNAAVSTQGSIIGYNKGSSGTVTVTGDGSTSADPSSLWTTGGLVVGSSGKGDLAIQNGGQVWSSGNSSIGSEKGSSGTATVTGGGSVWWLPQGGLVVGGKGEGSLTVEDGGSVVTDEGDSYLGSDDGSAGTVTVTGAGSKWDAAGHGIGVGFNGQGTLNVEDGGSVSARTVTVGGSGQLDFSSAVGNVTVTGAGSLLDANTLYLGNGGQATLTVDDGGVVDSKDILMGYIIGGGGTINLSGMDGARGALQTSYVTTIGGLNQINFNGGILRASADAKGSIIDGSPSGPITVSILAGGAFVDTNGADISIGIGMSGAGGFTKLGEGTLTLSGGNSYSGVTTVEEGTLLWGGGLNSGGFVQQGAYIVNGGTLDLGSGHGRNAAHANDYSLTMSSLSGSGGTVKLNQADLIVDQAVDTSFAGIITGAGGLTKNGAGTLTLLGKSTYSGGTTIAGGHMVISSDGSLGSGPVNVNEGTTMAFEDTATAGDGDMSIDGGVNFFDQASAGSASITTRGFGLSFNDDSTAGNATITVESGPLNFYANASAGTAIINNNYFLLFNGSNTADGATITNGPGSTLDLSLMTAGIGIGSLSGGGVVKIGSQSLTLGGLEYDDTISGVIEDGYSGSGGSLFKVGSGVLTLTGANTYTGQTVVSDGTLVVNGSIVSDVTVEGSGTLGGTGAVGGDVINAATVAPGNSIGTLTIAGDLTQQANGALVLESDFAGGRIDRLAVSGDATLDGRVEVRATSVLPDVWLPFLTAGGTLDHSLSASSSIFDYAVTQAGNALSLSAASAHFGEPGFSLNDDQDKVAEHLQDAWEAGGGSLGSLFGTLGSLADDDPSGYANALSDLSPGVAGAAAAGSIATTQQHLDTLLSCPVFADGTSFLTETECAWGQAGGQALNQKAGGGVSGFDTTTYSLQTGMQREVSPDWFVGFAGGYDRSSTDSDDGRVEADGDIVYGGAVLKHQTGPWLLSGAIAGSYGWYDSTRTIGIPGFAGQAESDPEVYNLSARFRAAYTVAQGDYYIRPLVDFDLIYSHANGYRESGAGLLDLAVDDSGQWSFHATPALEVGTRMALSETTVMRAFAAAGVSFGSADSWETTARLANAPDGTGSFDSEIPLAQVVGRLTAGVDLASDNGFGLRVNYQGAFSDTYTSHGGALRLSYRF